MSVEEKARGGLTLEQADDIADRVYVANLNMRVNRAEYGMLCVLAGYAEGEKDAMRRAEELAIGLTRTYGSLITNEQVEAVRLEKLLQALREIGPLPSVAQSEAPEAL